MDNVIPLSLLRAYFPNPVWEAICLAQSFADQKNMSLFLIGGCVRDFLEQRLFSGDLDLVTESSQSIVLAKALHQHLGGSLQVFSQYGTAKIQLDQFEIDLATARQEIYTSPGANPRVSFSSLEADLIRRDFTINAMAIQLNKSFLGRIIDPFGGIRDLKCKKLKALTAKKFKEDPVRSWRAIRFKYQFGFELEQTSAVHLKQVWDEAIFASFFTPRMTHEIHKILKLSQREACLKELATIGVFQTISPQFNALEWIERIGQLHQWKSLFPQQSEIEISILALLDSAHSVHDSFPKLLQALEIDRSTLKAWQALEHFHMHDIQQKPSQWTTQLESLPELALWLLLSKSNGLQQAGILRYLQEWRWVKPQISGKLIAKWVSPGPRIGEVLKRIRHAKLDGFIHSLEDEYQWAQHLAEGVQDK